MSYNSFTLDNGLRIIHTPCPIDVAYCGFAIDAGTRDEWPEEEGMAHFVEHLIFKGTIHRRAWHILNRMENVGGDLNAYTNKEETVVYSTFMKEHFARAVELLSDIVFHSTFPQQEIENEVEVIIDEIRSYEDTPAELIFDDFENMLFPEHPLGRNILGQPEKLRTFKTDDALQFVNRYYQPSNMVFFVQADLDFRLIVRTLEKYAGHQISTNDFPVKRIPPKPYTPTQKNINRHTHQAHVLLGCRGFSAYDSRRTGLYLLNNILGGPGMNSRLNVSLRERKGLVYNIESSLTTYTDTGTFCIYFGCNPEDTDHCIELVYKELNKIRNNGLTASQLQAAKKQLYGQLGVASDNFENNALDMGKCFLHYNHCDSPQDIVGRIDSLTPDHLREIAQNLFAEDNLSLLIYR